MPQMMDVSVTALGQSYFQFVNLPGAKSHRGIDSSPMLGAPVVESNSFLKVYGQLKNIYRRLASLKSSVTIFCKSICKFLPLLKRPPHWESETNVKIWYHQVSDFIFWHTVKFSLPPVNNTFVCTCKMFCSYPST